MIRWIPINRELPDFYKTVLAWHEEDLAPAVAFMVDNGAKGLWLRETEGPEDTYNRRDGKHTPLYRTPTHWAYINTPSGML